MSCPRSLKVFDTVASQVSALSFVDIFNFCVFLTFTICYTYQLFYVLVVLTRRAPKKVARANHRYAVMVAARNEETVIADLIHSIKVQNYPAELIDIFVIADNCTDNTADVAREAGAIVFPRSNDKLVGKGYALDYGLKAIWEQYADRDYEAFFVFDADNVLDVNYFREMNATFDNGAKASTSYRNSKNFGSNWILKAAGGWKWHLLTEDIEFSAASIIDGVRISYCPTAVLYDEQPITFRDSWNQRFRWAKGFYQVFAHYAGGLVKGTLTNPAGYRFACYDMLMTIAPGMLLSIISILFNTIIIVLAATGVMSTGVAIASSVTSVVFCLCNYVVFMFVFGVLTTFVEWDSIRTTTAKKIRYMFTFPFFMLTYIPIALIALVKKAAWKPIRHSISVDVAEFSEAEGVRLSSK